MKIRTGLNPYGLTYVLGRRVRDAARYAKASGLEGFIGLGRRSARRRSKSWEGWLLDERCRTGGAWCVARWLGMFAGGQFRGCRAPICRRWCGSRGPARA